MAQRLTKMKVQTQMAASQSNASSREESHPKQAQSPKPLEPFSRAKFRCSMVQHYEGDDQRVYFNAVGTDETEENKRFHKYSPDGKLEICVTNPKLKGAWKPGKSYYLDFTEAD